MAITRSATCTSPSGSPVQRNVGAPREWFTGAMSTSGETPRDPNGRPLGEQTDLPAWDQQQPPPSPQGWQATQSEPAHPTSTTSDERNWAMAAHLGSFLAAWFALGLLAPLAVLLFKGNDSAFVRRHAIESLNFQINALVYTILFVLLALLLIGFVLLPVYGLFYLICVILAAVRASAGDDYRYPLTIRFVS